MASIRGAMPGYIAWLPDRRVILQRDGKMWERERRTALATSPGHLRFWRLLDKLADIFWNASRRGIKLPIHNLEDVLRGIRCVGCANLPRDSSRQLETKMFTSELLQLVDLNSGASHSGRLKPNTTWLVAPTAPESST